MTYDETLRRQLLRDLDRQHDLILQYAAGDRSMRPALDQLEGAIQIKTAFLRSAVVSRPI